MPIAAAAVVSEMPTHIPDHVDDYLREGQESDASDIHLPVNCQPTWRRFGIVEPIWPSAPMLTAADTERLAMGFLDAAQQKLLHERGYRFARAGGARAFDPTKDNPLLLPQAFDGKPDSTLEQFKTAVAQARDGKIAVMTFHGVPDIKHPWVNTTPEKFEAYLRHLKETGCKVVALRDLVKYLPAAK